MIVFLTTRSHSYTHQVLARERGLRLRLACYGAVFHRRRLPAATYIFSDLDRLHYWELELAAHLYRQLQRAGLQVLNDPARASQRFRLLRLLEAAGINQFRAWSLEATQVPDRYPLFLRTASAHRGVLTGLLQDRQAFERAVNELLERGVPRRELLAVEYCAEPVAPGLFRKLSVFRVGATMVSATCVHDSQWVAKSGVTGIAGPELYADELRIVREEPFLEPLRRVFEIAEIEYGRADFGLVAGRPQIYEINTNPSLEEPPSHPDPARLQASRLAYDKLLRAFAAIDTAVPSRAVTVTPHPQLKSRLLSRWLDQDRSRRP